MWYASHSLLLSTDKKYIKYGRYPLRSHQSAPNKDFPTGARWKNTNDHITPTRKGSQERKRLTFPARGYNPLPPSPTHREARFYRPPTGLLPTGCGVYHRADACPAPPPPGSPLKCGPYDKENHLPPPEW